MDKDRKRERERISMQFSLHIKKERFFIYFKMCIFSCKYKPAGFKLEQILQLCYKIGSQVEREIINHVAVWSV